MAMAAHKLYCYAPQRLAVREFLHTVNPHFNDDNLGAVQDGYQLRGLRHINFIVVAGMKPDVPQTIHEVLRQRGAVVITLDDTYERVLAHSTHREHEPA
jgi:hypothetical protein